MAIALPAGGERVPRSRPLPPPMVRRSHALACLLAALPVLAGSWAPPAHGGGGGGGGIPQDPLIVGEATVRVVDDTHLNQALAILAKQFPAVRVLDSIAGHDVHLLGYGLTGRQSNDTFLAALNALAAKGILVWDELNYGAQTAEGKTDSLWVSNGAIGAPSYVNQYAWPLIGLDAAHARTTGYGTVIAVLDTGVDASHPALAGRVLPTSFSVVDALPSTAEFDDGIDVDGDGQTAEMFGHGTFVAGLIAAVAPDASILSVRVLDDDGYGDLYRITKAMYWAIDQGVDVVNMSLGSTYKSVAVESAAADAWSLGIAVVGAAGNLGIEDPREYPACQSTAIGVAATDGTDLKATFSNFNSKLALSAPGDTVFLANGAPDAAQAIISCVPGGGWAAWEGTSLSTALVSGAVALVRAQHPEWPNAAVPAGTIVDEILATLATTAEPLDGNNPDFNGMLGAGRISVGAAAAAGPIQPRPGDIDLDGTVGAKDLSLMLGSWGSCIGCPADINHDGVVDAADLSVLLGAWS